VSPDVLTAWGVLVSAAVAAVAAAGGRWPLAAVGIVVLAGLLDNLDGAVAILSGRTTRWGYVLDSLADRLSDDFKGNGTVDKAEAAATLRRYFAAYESVHLLVYEVAVPRRTEGEADVAFRAEFKGSARRIGGLDGFLPPSAVERFDLRLARRGSDWKVIAADWRPIEPLTLPSP
jgi:hypothetical protein